MSPFSTTLLEHFRSPRNRGPLAQATGRGTAANDACGDQVAIEVRLERGAVAAAAFEAAGCSAAVGAASYLTERVRGLAAAAAAGLEPEALLRECGESAATRRHGMQLAVRALREALGVPA